jgi:16S rRNA (adenine1518-N6/adenine1519-N6)-dimethyltransferase
VPKVDSACIHLEVYDSPPVRAADEELFRSVVKTAFGQRRKTLHNSLKSLAPDIDGALEAAGISPGARPETLKIEDFARIADKVNR